MCIQMGENMRNAITTRRLYHALEAERLLLQFEIINTDDKSRRTAARKEMKACDALIARLAEGRAA
jgi:hypothetical protein